MKHYSLVFDFMVLQGNLLFLKLNSISAGQNLYFPIRFFFNRKIMYTYTDIHIYISINIKKNAQYSLTQKCWLKNANGLHTHTLKTSKCRSNSPKQILPPAYILNIGALPFSEYSSMFAIVLPM